MTSLALPDISRPADSVTQIEIALARRIGDDRFDMWFDRKADLRLDHDILHVTVANAFAANFIRGKFSDDLRAAAREVLLRDIQVQIDIETRAKPQLVEQTDARASASLSLGTGTTRASIPCSTAHSVAAQSRSAKTRAISASRAPRWAAACRTRRLLPKPETPTAILCATPFLAISPNTSPPTHRLPRLSRWARPPGRPPPGSKAPSRPR